MSVFFNHMPKSCFPKHLIIRSLILLAASISFAQSPPPAEPAAAGIPSRLALKQAEELLLQRSVAVAASRQQVDINVALRQIAGLKPNPTLQIGAEQIPFTSPVHGSAPRLFATNSDAGANPVYTLQYGRIIERGGKREIRQQQAGELLEASRAQVLDTFRQQLLQLRVAFTSALLAKENIRLAAETESEYAQTEELMVTRFRTGDIAGVDLERVRLARLPYQQAVLDARAAYWQAGRDIQGVLSANPETARSGPAPAKSTLAALGAPPPVEVTGDLADMPLTSTLEELRTIALRERPDLQAARRNFNASESGVRLAQAQRVRDVFTAFEYQRVGEDNSVGAIVSFPLFVYNNQQQVIAQSVAQQRLAATQVKLAELQVLTDVDKAYQAVMAARRVLDIYSPDTLNRAVQIRQTVTYSYQRGEASLLEVLDAQRAATQILVSVAQAKANYLNAIWQLQNAIGTTF